MFTFDRATALQIAQELLGALSAANPEVAAAGLALGSLVQLQALFKGIKNNHPDVWAQISAEYRDALADFDAAHGL